MHLEPDKIQIRIISQNHHLDVICLEFPCNLLVKGIKILGSFRKWTMPTIWFCPILKFDWERGLRRLKKWVSQNYGRNNFESKFKLFGKNWMQTHFWFLKLMPLGQNKGKSEGRPYPKIKNLKIGFDIWIPFFFLIEKHPLLQFYVLKW